MTALLLIACLGLSLSLSATLGAALDEDTCLKPALTRNNTKCENDWVLGEVDGEFNCYRLYPIKKVRRSPHLTINTTSRCIEFHPRSLAVYIKSQNELDFLNKFYNDYIVGLFKVMTLDYESYDKTKFKWTDNSSVLTWPVPWAPGQPLLESDYGPVFIIWNQQLYVERSDQAYLKHQGVLCKAKATPVVDCFPRYPVEDPDAFHCDEGWEKASHCGPVFCYKKVAVNTTGLQLDFPAPYHYCGELYPGSFSVSMHCTAEDQWLFKFGPFTTGLHVPITSRWGRNQFIWEDETPTDYLAWWDDSIDPQPDSSYTIERVTEHDSSWGRMAWGDWHKSNSRQVVCKRKAHPNVPVKPVKVAGCVTPTASYYNTICPDETWVRQSFKRGVFCYKATSLGLLPSTEYLYGSVCQDQIHPKATPAVFKDVFEYDYPTLYFGDVFVGLFANATGPYATYQQFWIDGGRDLLNLYNVTEDIPTNDVLGSGLNIALAVKDRGFVFHLNRTLPINSPVLCQMPAAPLHSCFDDLTDDPTVKAEDHVCEDPSWEKFKSCGGQVHCYTRVEIPAGRRTLEGAIVDDICASLMPGSFLPSVHCLEEHEFLARFGFFPFGLHLPPGSPWNMSSFVYTDGSKYDFSLWDNFHSNQGKHEPLPGPDRDNRVVVNRLSSDRYGWTTVPSTFPHEYTVCKKPAVGKNVSGKSVAAKKPARGGRCKNKKRFP